MNSQFTQIQWLEIDRDGGTAVAVVVIYAASPLAWSYFTGSFLNVFCLTVAGLRVKVGVLSRADAAICTQMPTYGIPFALVECWRERGLHVSAAVGMVWWKFPLFG